MEGSQEHPTLYRAHTPSTYSLSESYEAKRSPRGIPPVPSSPIPLSPTSQLDLPLRRSSPQSFGYSSQSSNSRYSTVASPRSITSSHIAHGMSSLEQTVLNIGIDFGTTYSGVAWAVSGLQRPDINVVQNWPGRNNVKVPTEICYPKDGGVLWGYSIPPDVERLQWFKLLLLKDGHLPDQVRDSKQLKATRQLLQKLDKPLVQVIADYLRQLWKCALNDIRRRLGHNSVSGMLFRVILTVPANWPKEARDEMKRAASQAGILDDPGSGLETKLEFVGEPEAAALAVFHDGNARQNIQAGIINVGDIVVICDAGGGTVDIVTYEIERGEPAVHLGESVGNDMELCGSTVLDDGFQDHMETLMGKGKLMKFPKGIQHALMSTWEQNVKCLYEHGTPEITINLPHDVAKAIKTKNIFKRGNAKQLSGDALKFPADDIVKVFDPVLSKILTLINKQVSSTMRQKQRKPKAIVLVGGLGGNTFLYQRLQAEFAAGDVSIIQPQGLKTWSSICRGAAIKGLTYDDYDDQVLPVVISYISKAHYGIAYKVPFDADKGHLEEDRRFDAAKNMDLAWNQMQWFVAKGDDVSKGNPVTMPWERYQPESRPMTSFTVKMYECEANTAPSRITDEVRECEPLTVPVNWNELLVVDGANGQKFRRIQFDLKMTMSGMGKLDFATYVDGKLVARKGVSVKVGESQMVSTL